MKTKSKRVLVVGSGAREHALGARLASEGCTLFFAPGNGGTASVGTNVPIKSEDVVATQQWALEQNLDLVVIGPEGPLVLGLADLLRGSGIPAFGPGKRAAALEGSKRVMKEFAVKYGIPTAGFRAFEKFDDARAYVQKENRPFVVKADGLCAGKGVVVARTVEETLEALDACLNQRVFGDAGNVAIVEELLPGEEASFHFVVENDTYFALPTARDYKRVFDGDVGPNTGGMGCVSPAPIVTESVAKLIHETIVLPTMRGLREEGMAFHGVLFAGLMVENGIPRLLEYNVRFGDPETTVLLSQVQGDLFELLRSPADAVKQGLVSLKPRTAISVVLASEGYPAKPQVGRTIDLTGVNFEGSDPHTSYALFHAGTAVHADLALPSDETPESKTQGLMTSGGRVLVVHGSGNDISVIRKNVYAVAAKVAFQGKHYRRDIGL